MGFDQTQFLLVARVWHISTAISTIHYGYWGSSWQGTAAQGEFCFHNGSGDSLVAAWSPDGVVGLVFDHESQQPRVRVKEGVITGIFAEIPLSLRSLLNDVGQWVDGEFTTALWSNAGGAIEGPGVNALGVVFPSLDITHAEWAESQSLDETQMALALKLAQGPWNVPLAAADAERMVRTPRDSNQAPENREWTKCASEMLREVGVDWEPSSGATGEGGK